MEEKAQVVTRLAAGGRLVIPIAFRRKLGLEEGDDVIVELRGARLQIVTRDQALRELQDEVCSAISGDVDLVSELIKERRRDSASE
jgi:bifunctional DNA-binding transcriptional regulator/antitoxin component of YhaV-PrlF toxin-antitoxin module